jgi:hypothetical protein
MNETDWLDSHHPREMLERLQCCQCGHPAAGHSGISGGGACRAPDCACEQLHDLASQRKLRLFAVACCRRLRNLSEGTTFNAVLLAERYADGQATPGVLLRAFRKLERLTTVAGDHYGRDVSSAFQACTDRPNFSASRVAALATTAVASYAGGGMTGFIGAKDGEQAAQAELLRDIFENPFRAPEVYWEETATGKQLVRVLRRLKLPKGPLYQGETLYEPLPWLSWNDHTVPKIAQAIYEERAFDRMPILADALEEADCTNQEILNHCREPGLHARGCWVIDLLTGKE